MEKEVSSFLELSSRPFFETDLLSSSLPSQYPLGEKQSWQHAYQYKYLFDIDGNTFSGRFIGLLMGGSLVFKSTIWQEFFTPWLKPVRLCFLLSFPVR